MPSHKCHLCGYTCHEYIEFALHIRSHDGEGPSHCSVCGRPLYRRNRPGTAGSRTNNAPPANPKNLHEAAAKGLLDHVKDFLSKGEDINGRRFLDATALIKAIEKGHLDVMHHLIHAGANINLANAFGVTPLLEAICANLAFDIRKEMVITLLHAGANPNIGILPASVVYLNPIIMEAMESPAIVRAASIGAPDIAAACLAHGARQVNACSISCCYGSNVSDETKGAFQEVLNNPLSLENQAIRVIRSHIMNKDDISELPLPPPIKKRCLSLYL